MKLFLIFICTYILTFSCISGDIELPPLFDEPTSEKEMAADGAVTAPKPLYKKERKPQLQVKVAALVNGQPITMVDIINRMTMVSNNPIDQLSEAAYKQLQTQVLNLMVAESVKRQITKRVGLKVTSAELKQALTMIEKQNKMSAGGLRKALKAKGVPWHVLEDSIQADIAWKHYISILANASIEVRKKDIKKLIHDQNKDTQLNLAEIAVHKNRLGGDGERAREQLQAAIQSMNDGMTFVDAALKYSHASSAARGGQVGWIAQSQLNSIEKEALKDLSPGQATDPIATKLGYKVYFLIDKKVQTEKDVSLITARQLEVKVSKEDRASNATLQGKKDQLTRLVHSISSCDEFDQLTEQIPGAQVHVYRSVQLSDLSQDLRHVLKDMKVGKPGHAIYNKANHTIVFFLVCERGKGKPENVKDTEMIANQISNRRFIALSQQKLQEAHRLSSIDVRI